ncbi:twin transmembrane helix small protein [Cognatazoarcus halotolerans]|uniref:twin transmembrane helix small protein n=1 Tax=Cognatazoarcus halotolerans TaxID=2686016 RepID=UPI001356CE14|nr:twin transmembrane helix small protein [Cognatazoarcus halotolerans]MBX3678809.1 twin transmembrane helix small protein [Rhodocyclaceae bacterium]MCB1900465.1 twin transmembrane helix small protein [Rhodocyclaceae bacterium]MCP5309863.1 twin transmembrane helix small protein [Zoogloeaceae bacterium]
MRILVIVFLLLILASLGSALLFLLRDKGQGERTVKALAIRVGLSITLFLILMGGFASGWLTNRL